MERIKTIATRDLTKSVKTGGCGDRLDVWCVMCRDDFGYFGPITLSAARQPNGRPSGLRPHPQQIANRFV